MSRVTREARLRALEDRIKPPACPQCGGRPMCINYRDPETRQVWEQEFTPETGCPKCGMLPQHVLDIMLEQEVSA